MDKKRQKDNSLSIDDVVHSHNLEKYKVFVLQPQRSSLLFTDTYDDTIITLQIKQKINFLKIHGFKFDDICEIKCTEKTWYLKYNGTIDNFDKNIGILIKDITLVYLYINGHIYKDNKMIDIVNDIEILYNPYSFRQNDISIKNIIYDVLKTEIVSKNLYLIGGEMVFYTALLKPLNIIMYTDFESIYDDAVTNFKNLKSDIHLINYDKDKLEYRNNDYSLIANTSKHGLGDNLCKEINKLNLNEIIIISCNKISFVRDYKKLQIKYKLTKLFDINTNYSVSIYFLTKK